MIRKKILKFKFFRYKKFTHIGKLYLKLSFTNIFCTLTDMKDQVINACSSGIAGVRGTSRRKIAPQALEFIIKYMVPHFIKKRILRIQLILRDGVNKLVYSLIKELSYYGIKVVSIFEKKLLAHNGVRPRKMRRK
jgi:ribosomal protein S11